LNLNPLARFLKRNQGAACEARQSLRLAPPSLQKGLAVTFPVHRKG